MPGKSSEFVARRVWEAWSPQASFSNVYITVTLSANLWQGQLSRSPVSYPSCKARGLTGDPGRLRCFILLAEFFQGWNLSVSCSVVSDSLQAHGLKPSRLFCPWNSPAKNYWSGLPFPFPGDLPDLGIKPRSPALQADSWPSEPSEKLRMKLAGHKRWFGEGYVCALSLEGNPEHHGNRCSAKGCEPGAGVSDQTLIYCLHLRV